MRKLARVLAASAAALSIAVSGLASANAASAKTPPPPKKWCVGYDVKHNVSVSPEHTYLQSAVYFMYWPAGSERGGKSGSIDAYAGVRYVGKNGHPSQTITGTSYVQVDGGSWTSAHRFSVHPGRSYSELSQSYRALSHGYWGHKVRVVFSLPGDGTYTSPWYTMTSTDTSACLGY